MKKDFTNEEAYPDYFVKIEPVQSLIPKPYGYYQDAPRYDADETVRQPKAAKHLSQTASLPR